MQISLLAWNSYVILVLSSPEKKSWCPSGSPPDWGPEPRVCTYLERRAVLDVERKLRLAEVGLAPVPTSQSMFLVL